MRGSYWNIHISGLLENESWKLKLISIRDYFYNFFLFVQNTSMKVKLAVILRNSLPLPSDTSTRNT